VKPTVLLDVDGVLADFTAAALELVRQVTGHRYDPSDVVTWEIFDSIPEKAAQEEVYRILKGPGGCTSIPLYPDAQGGVQALREVADIVIVTSPFTNAPTWTHERELWLKKHFGDFQSIIHTKHKERIHGDFFIDDKPSHIKEWLDYWVRSGRDTNVTGMVWKTPRLLRDVVDPLAVQVSDWVDVLHGLMHPRPPALEHDPRACPCLHTTPCQPDCTCVTPWMSHGCMRCCSYGSPEQQKAMAEHLAPAIDESWEAQGS